MCKIEGCICDKIFAKDLCYRHYNQLKKLGKITDRLNYNLNNITIKKDMAIIDLYDRHDSKIAECIIDVEDVDKIKNFGWHLEKSGRYTNYCSSYKLGAIHRYLMNVKDSSIVVDHINQNGLDNRKCNLRVCTNQNNICNCKIPKNNKSGCKGVYWSKDKNKWTVQITINNKTKYIGRFSSYEDAVKARKEASKQYYGEFAND